LAAAAPAVKANRIKLKSAAFRIAPGLRSVPGAVNLKKP
jgi:hypothetical protein